MFPVLCVELSGSNVQKALNGREAEYDYSFYNVLREGYNTIKSVVLGDMQESKTSQY